ncbi:MAG: tRNA dihydrouridine synthase DusB [Syntrophothermus sp.]
MHIGSFIPANPVILAPMAGVTDTVFRRLAIEFGCGMVWGEMVSAKAVVYGNDRSKAMLKIAPEERPMAIQLFGSEPEIMAQAARIAETYRPEALDINMGCPTPKIVKNGEGAALMRNPDLAGRVVEAVAQAVNLPVTVKMRKGWDAGSVNAVEMAKTVEAAGAKAITVHGRTREAFYSGRADWEIIGQVKEAVKIPVIGNGDVDSPQAARAMLDETGCDGVMVGRAALGNPWLLKRIAHYLATGEFLPPPTTAERLKLAERHLEMIVAHKGEHIGVREMRKHAAWYMKGLAGASRAKEAVNRATTAEMMRAIFRAMGEAPGAL